MSDTMTIRNKEIRKRDLRGKRIAIVATDGFEQVELTEPLDALREMGAEVNVIAPDETREAGKIRGWNAGDWGDAVPVDEQIERADPDTYDALVLPGGVLNPDKLRMRKDATTFVRAFFKSGKPVGAICHGLQTLIDSGVLAGRTVTSYPSVKIDLKNAGVRWEDREVVVDDGLVTSRSPADLPAFIDKVAEEVMEGVHAGQETA